MVLIGITNLEEEEKNNERILEFKRTWQFIEGSGCEVVLIGNSRGKHYFSFWLEFIAQHKKFQNL